MLIREIRKEEYELLKDFLYEAIFIPEGVQAPDRSIIEKEELAVYYENFGNRDGDHCLLAIEDDKPIGAVWSRIMNDYGYVDDQTPSLAVSLFKEYRHKGIGTKLMREMLKLLKEEGYRKASLAVQKDNYAYRMYKDLGFVTVKENDQEYIMVNELQKELELKELYLLEIEKIKPLLLNVFSSPPWNEDWSDEKQFDEYLRDLIEVRGSLLYGLYLDEELIGVSIGKIKHWCSGTEYYIDELFIAKEYQNHGYGKEFLRMIEDKLPEKGVCAIYLMTDKDKPAFEFYKKMGFEELKETTAFFKKF